MSFSTVRFTGWNAFADRYVDTASDSESATASTSGDAETDRRTTPVYAASASVNSRSHWIIAVWSAQV
ncbi:hypothetical protein JCM9534A_18490 [Catenuloplanes indicus JCM 9534]